MVLPELTLHYWCPDKIFNSSMDFADELSVHLYDKTTENDSRSITTEIHSKADERVDMVLKKHTAC